ncbi:MAG TPA: ABC transporter ATP-binding protein [Kiloniellaceae bacterium]|nr:ABC transporter ATP-binding protein [Kiloniellaceae bacterium]
MAETRPLALIEAQDSGVGTDRSGEARPSGSPGARVEVRDLSKRFGSVVAIDDVSFEMHSGEFVALLGPSGSGKTTVLMNIAGFQRPSAGQIFVGDRDVVPLPANKRGIGMVFQRYALFPHMTVAENIAFPLKMRRWPRARRAAAVAEALSVVRLDGLAERMPSQLSGGQQQRVALGRAIVFEPPLLLMDEPLGALDKKLREELQVELKSLQRRLGVTVLFVTHDQDEALAMSDRIAVMNAGRIEQIGSPDALYQRPRTLFVADFMGDSNLFEGSVESVDHSTEVVTVGCAGLSLRGGAGQTPVSAFRPGDRACVMVRPESVAIAPSLQGGKTGISGVVEAITFSGARHSLQVRVRNRVVKVLSPVVPGRLEPGVGVGDRVRLSWEPSEAVALPGMVSP